MADQNELTATDRGLKEKPEGDGPDPTPEAVADMMTNSKSSILPAMYQATPIVSWIMGELIEFIKEKAKEEGYDAVKDKISNWYNGSPGCQPFTGRDINQITCTHFLNESGVYMAHTIENHTCETLIPIYKWAFKGQPTYGPSALIPPGTSMVAGMAGLSSSIGYIYRIGETGESAIIGFANPIRPYQNRVFVKVGPSNLIEGTNVNTVQQWIDEAGQYVDSSQGDKFAGAAETVSGSSAFFASAIYPKEVSFAQWEQKYFTKWAQNDLDKEGL